MASNKNSRAANAAKKAAEKSGAAQTALAVAPPVALQGIPSNFKVRRALQLPTLVMKEAGIGRTLAFLSGLRVSTVAAKNDKEARATVATVADVDTGEQMLFLVPAVVESVLCDTFAPSHERPERDNYAARESLYASCDLTGKVFYIRNDGKKKPAQRHVDFTVLEGEPLEVKAAE